MATLLTIDWDYFVPLKLEYDFGHAETPFHLDAIWQLRADFIDKIKPTRSARTFWAQAEERMKFLHGANETLFVSESHASAFDLLQTYEDMIDRVIIIDTHHDCWPMNGEGVGCDNWLTAWLSLDDRRRATWIYPEWIARQHGIDIYCDIFPGVAERLDVMRFRDVPSLLGEVEIDAVHACRSGCWTPPWCDAAWLRFLSDRNLTPLAESPWDGLKSRWEPGKAREYARMLAESRANLKIKMCAQWGE